MANVRSARLVLLPGADHYVFLDPCTARGKAMSPETCVDKNGLDRVEVQQRVVREALAFFRKALAR